MIFMVHNTSNATLQIPTKTENPTRTHIMRAEKTFLNAKVVDWAMYTHQLLENKRKMTDIQVRYVNSELVGFYFHRKYRDECPSNIADIEQGELERKQRARYLRGKNKNAI